MDVREKSTSWLSSVRQFFMIFMPKKIKNTLKLSASSLFFAITSWKTNQTTTRYAVHLWVNNGDNTSTTSSQGLIQFVACNEKLTYWCFDVSMKKLFWLLLTTAKRERERVREQQSDVRSAINSFLPQTHLFIYFFFLYFWIPCRGSYES